MKPPESPDYLSPTLEDDSITLKSLRPIDHLFLQSLGYIEDSEHSASGWMHLEYDVQEHTDNSNYGRCFLYCAEGSGTLQVYNRKTSKTYRRHMSPGKTLVFNDHHDHSFTITQAPCILMVADLKKG